MYYFSLEHQGYIIKRYVAISRKYSKYIIFIGTFKVYSFTLRSCSKCSEERKEFVLPTCHASISCSLTPRLCGSIFGNKLLLIVKTKIIQGVSLTSNSHVREKITWRLSHQVTVWSLVQILVRGYVY